MPRRAPIGWIISTTGIPPIGCSSPPLSSCLARSLPMIGALHVLAPTTASAMGLPPGPDNDPQATVCMTSPLHLHHLFHGNHVLVEVGHDPQRTADDQRDDQDAESQCQHIVGVVWRRRD